MDTTPNPPQVKQGALIGGWVCFALGMLIMYWSMWLFIVYGPLFLVAFILSISALSQRRILGGIALLLLTLTAPLVTWLALGVTRTGAVINKASDYIEAENRKHGFVAPQIGPNGQFIPGHLIAPAATPTVAAPTNQLKPLSSQEIALIEKDYGEDIAGADASRIIVTNSRTFGPCDSFQGISVGFGLNRGPRGPSYPRATGNLSFSPDGRSVLYSAEINGGISLLARNLVTGEILREFALHANVRNVYRLAWASDGKRAMVMDGNGRLVVVNFEEQKQIDLPPIQLPNGCLAVLWRNENALQLVQDNGVSTLDLNDLTISGSTRFPEHSDAETEINRLIAGDGKLARTFLNAESVGRNGTAYLTVQDPAGPTSFTALLIPGFNGGYVASPDLHCILTNQSGTLNVYYLGLRPAPRRNYWLEIDNAKLLTPEAEKNRLNWLRRGAVFTGQVYAPKINPLNGKPIGANPDVYKGEVAISGWHEHFLEVTTQWSTMPFQPGDVVVNLRTPTDSGNFHFENYEQLWRPLMFDVVPGADGPPPQSASGVSTTPLETPGTANDAPNTSASGQDGYSTPPEGSALRKQLLDVIREPVATHFGQPVVFKVSALRATDAWTFFVGTAIQPNDAPVDYRRSSEYKKDPTAMQAALDAGVLTGSVDALLKKEGAEWKILALTYDATDVHWLDYDKRFGVPRKLVADPVGADAGLTGTSVNTSQAASTPRPGMIRVPNVTVETATSEFPVSIMAEGPGYLDFNDPRIDEFHVRHRVSLEYFHAHYRDFLTIDHYRVRDGKNDPPNPNLPILQPTPMTRQTSSVSYSTGTPLDSTDTAEKRLNIAYQQLRQRLNEAQKTRLKQEEIRWIKQKESVPLNDPRRVEMIERRISELQNWR